MCVKEQYYNLGDYYSTNFDAFLYKLPLAHSYWKIPCLAIMYLAIVLKIGPMLMKNRSPILWVKKVIPIYNAVQVFCNLTIVLWAFSDFNFVKSLVINVCGNSIVNVEYGEKFIFLGYLWCILKISDFFDTFFFIILKKHSHVSFLHVYHHSMTMILAFIVFRFVRVEQFAGYAAVNCCVHIFMYTYYFFTSLGYKPKWKKVVTLVQLLQFVILIFFTIILIMCQEKPHYIYMSIYSLCQCLMYIFLFGRFFKNAYKKD